MHTHLTSLKSAIFISKQLTAYSLLNQWQFHRSGVITYILQKITTYVITAADLASLTAHHLDLPIPKWLMPHQKNNSSKNNRNNRRNIFSH